MTHARYLTIGEAAEYLKLSRETLYKYVQRGEIPAAKVGRHWRLDREAIDGWMAGRMERSTGPVAEAPAAVRGRRMRTMHVLVVDDDAGIRRLLEIWIGAEGDRVDAAGSGAEALAKLTSRTAYDLIFLDLNLPDLTGGQVLGRLQEHENRPPVVLVTGYGDTPLMEQALHYDLLYVLSKPFERLQVRNLLHSVRATREWSHVGVTTARSDLPSTVRARGQNAPRPDSR